MFGISHYEMFLLAGIVLNITPGPDTLYILGRSVVAGASGRVVFRVGQQFRLCGTYVVGGIGFVGAFGAVSRSVHGGQNSWRPVSWVFRTAAFAQQRKHAGDRANRRSL